MSTKTGRYRTGSPVEPRSYDHVACRPLEGGAVRLEGGFWGKRQELNREVTIPHGMDMLEEWGCLDNLRLAAGRGDKVHRLPLFMDSDLYKVLEAISWERQHGPVKSQERFFAEAVELLAAAQEADGYINSYVQVVQGGKRFADPAMGHELYCAGHLFQASIAEGRSGVARSGRRSLRDVADRFARYLLTALPEMPTYVDGHPEVEMALVELYREQGHKRYLALAEDIIARRGRARLRFPGFHADYFQDDVAVMDARDVRGHAVRALYLLCGVTDAYMETGRRELLEPCVAQWDDMVSGKTYLTGGLGSRHEGEAFGDRFELPSDRAYCETCAAIASIMWSWRLSLVTGQARYGELLERTLYNAALAGWGLDGKSFFYVNPLQSRGGVTRQRWHRVACCPPNLMRLVASLEHYVATRAPDGLQLQQFMPATIDTEVSGGRLRGHLHTDYPYDGSLSFSVEEAPEAPVDLAIRVPSWSPGPALVLNGASREAAVAADGYMHIRRVWRPGDEASLELDMSARVVRPDPRIDALRGCFALERGPFVYCFEPAGLTAQGEVGTGHLEGVYGVPADGLTERGGSVGTENIVGLVLSARKSSRNPGTGWPYLPQAEDGRRGGRPVELAAVPYYSWCNRGTSEMRVWLPELVGSNADR